MNPKNTTLKPTWLKKTTFLIDCVAINLKILYLHHTITRDGILENKNQIKW
jgi:hypothetical protein